MSLLIIKLLLCLVNLQAQTCVDTFRSSFFIEGRIVTVRAPFVNYDRSMGFDGAFRITFVHPHSVGMQVMPAYFGGKIGVELERRFLDMRYPDIHDLGSYLLSGRLEEIDGEFYVSLFKLWRKPENHGKYTHDGAEILKINKDE